ncbi:hypothetical protein EDB85DRAFT_1899376 [Lactarius pseudohatsudake]|nr:hypothetical protein EDB85DRAFT_1899376 [Lactarius pseudohatsudake]
MPLAATVGGQGELHCAHLTSRQMCRVRRAAQWTTTWTTTTQQATAVTTAVGILHMKPRLGAACAFNDSDGHESTTTRSHCTSLTHWWPRAACAINRSWCPAITGPVVATLTTTTAETVPLTVLMEGTPSTQPRPRLYDDDDDDDDCKTATARRCRQQQQQRQQDGRRRRRQQDGIDGDNEIRQLGRGLGMQRDFS